MKDGLIQDEFFESVKMSTYLVAFIVGEMKNLTQDINGTLVCGSICPKEFERISLMITGNCLMEETSFWIAALLFLCQNAYFLLSCYLLLLIEYLKVNNF